MNKKPPKRIEIPSIMRILRSKGFPKCTPLPKNRSLEQVGILYVFLLDLSAFNEGSVGVQKESTNKQSQEHTVSKCGPAARWKMQVLAIFQNWPNVCEVRWR